MLVPKNQHQGNIENHANNRHHHHQEPIDWLGRPLKPSHNPMNALINQISRQHDNHPRINQCREDFSTDQPVRMLARAGCLAQMTGHDSSNKIRHVRKQMRGIGDNRKRPRQNPSRDLHRHEHHRKDRRRNKLGADPSLL
jgi:hypothetical protein